MSNCSIQCPSSMSRLTRRGLIAGVAGLTSVVGLPGDAGGRQSTPTSTSPFGTPIISLGQMPGFDAARDPGLGSDWLSTLIYDSPLQVDLEGRIRGGIVVDWHTSQDGLLIDLRVRSDAIFSDGTIVTEADVAASLERCRSPGTGVTTMGRWERIDRIEATESGIVRISLSQPDAAILPSLASARVPVVPEHWADRAWSGTPDGMPPGSGPFTFSAMDERQITLGRHPGYWQVGRPHLAGVAITGSSETVPRSIELATGAVDFIVDAPLLDIPTLRDDPNLTLVGGPANRLCFLTTNLRTGVLQDRRVRSLVSGAIDRVALIDAAVASEGEPATGLFPRASWVQSDAEPEPAPISPEEIRFELSALGYLAGLPLRLIADEADASLANACIMLQEQFAYAGIAVTLDLLDGDGISVALREGSWDLLAMYSSFWRDPDELLRPMLREDGDGNVGGYRGARASILIDRARTTPYLQQRAELYQRLQAIVRDDVPVIPLFFPAYYDAMRRRMSMYVAYPPVTALAMRQARIQPPDQPPSR